MAEVTDRHEALPQGANARVAIVGAIRRFFGSGFGRMLAAVAISMAGLALLALVWTWVPFHPLMAVGLVGAAVGLVIGGRAGLVGLLLVVGALTWAMAVAWTPWFWPPRDPLSTALGWAPFAVSPALAGFGLGVLTRRHWRTARERPPAA